jgi:Holliday junction resolvasome RuvABC endonuclease subunit
VLGDAVVVAGTWDLAKGKSEAAVARFERLREHLDGLAYVPNVCAYELVQWRHKSTRAARIYWGLVAVLELWCGERGIPLIPISVANVKRRATGRGDASKDDMLEAAAETFPDVELASHDTADALFVAAAAVDNLEQGEALAEAA